MGLIYNVSNVGGGILLALRHSLHENRNVILVNISYVSLVEYIFNLVWS